MRSRIWGMTPTIGSGFDKIPAREILILQRKVHNLSQVAEKIYIPGTDDQNSILNSLNAMS